MKLGRHQNLRDLRGLTGRTDPLSRIHVLAPQILRNHRVQTVPADPRSLLQARQNPHGPLVLTARLVLTVRLVPTARLVQIAQIVQIALIVRTAQRKGK